MPRKKQPEQVVVEGTHPVGEPVLVSKPTISRRSKAAREQRDIEMKARAQGVPVSFIKNQFIKGVVHLRRKKGVKQAAEEYLMRLLDFVVPDEWLMNGLEPLRGKKVTFGQAIAFRLAFHGVTGTKNAGFKDTQELMNRMMGKIPLVVKHSDEDESDVIDLTDDQLRDELARLGESIRVKRLPAAPKERNAAKEEAK